MKKRLLLAPLLSALLASSLACGAEPSLDATSPQESPSVDSEASETSESRGVARESEQTIRRCEALKKLGITKRPRRIANPCAQAERLGELFRMNPELKKDFGFEVRVGDIRPSGIRLLVVGDAESARQALADDPLVGVIRTKAQGF